jgi:transposase InsO family protein
VRAGETTGHIFHLDRASFCVPVVIYNAHFKALIDTGASVSCVHRGVVKSLMQMNAIDQSATQVLLAADGRPIKVYGQIKFKFTLQDVKYEHSLHVIDSSSHDIILGLDFLCFHRISLDCYNRALITAETRHHVVQISPQQQSSLAESINVSQSHSDGLSQKSINPSTVFCAGRAKIKPINIRLIKSAIPRRQKVRQKALVEKKIVNEEVEKMLAMGVIRDSQSPWASPIQLEKKKDGSVRFCVDYRYVNTQIQADAYPLPLINDLIGNLYEAKIFSALDLKSGYWQLPLDEESKPVTAFATANGLYEFNVLPFGLSIAPAVFQRSMNKLFMKMPFVAVYMDDIIVFSNSLADHEIHLQSVKKVLAENGLVLNEKKCQFRQTQIDYLGMRISHGMVHIVKEKIEPILKLKPPTTKRQVQEFLGLVNFYRSFCPSLAEVAEPLYGLTHLNRSFEWTDKHEEAFENIKSMLTNPPLLKIPNPKFPFVISTDASDKALGAVLSQPINGKEFPIAFASRLLSEAEKNYSVIEKELLAIVFAVKKFRCYVYGNHFTVFTDHNPLQHAMTMKDPTKRIARWLMTLQDYDFEIKFRPGKENSNADYLSRHTVAPIVAGEEDTEYKLLLDGKKVPPHSPYNYMMGNIRMEAGELWLISKSGQRRKIPPPEGRERLVTEVHCLGHFGIRKTWKLISELFWWPGIYKAVKKQVESCQLCERRKPRSQARVSSNSNIPFSASYPMEVVAWDIMGPLPTSRTGNRYVVVVIDMFSRWVEIGALKAASSEELVQFMWRQIISRYGPPVRIHSDQAPNLNAAVLKNLYDKWGIRKSNTVSYYPQGNAMCERVNRVIQDIVAKKIDPSTDWDDQLAAAAFAHNVTPHIETGLAPFALFFGRQPHVSIAGNMVQLSSDRHACISDMWRQLAQRWREVYLIDEFTPGDLVWLWRPREPGAPKKFSLHWQGPFRVLSKKHWGNYVIETLNSAKNLTVNRAQLKKFRGAGGSVEQAESQSSGTTEARPNPPTDITTPAVSAGRHKHHYNLRPRIFRPRT